jgi:hypothetical protein
MSFDVGIKVTNCGKLNFISPTLKKGKHTTTLSKSNKVERGRKSITMSFSYFNRPSNQIPSSSFNTFGVDYQQPQLSFAQLQHQRHKQYHKTPQQQQQPTQLLPQQLYLNQQSSQWDNRDASHQQDLPRCPYNPVTKQPLPSPTTLNVEQKNWITVIIALLGVIVLGFLIDYWFKRMRQHEVEIWAERYRNAYGYPFTPRRSDGHHRRRHHGEQHQQQHYPTPEEIAAWYDFIDSNPNGGSDNAGNDVDTLKDM